MIQSIYALSRLYFMAFFIALSSARALSHTVKNKKLITKIHSIIDINIK